jgi:hypothetical protein
MALRIRLLTIFFLCILSLTGKANVYEETKKVSLIFIGPAQGLSESSFGHVALKLSPDRDGGLLDMAVEFVADIPKNEKAARKYIHGAGIGKKYPVKADLSSFYDFRKRKTINENRTLTVYDLNLSSSEVSRVTEFIRDYENKTLKEDYLFLTKNCSYFAARALEFATGKSIHNKNFPWKISSKLKALGLVTGEKKYDNASHERERLAKKFLPELSFPEEWKDTFPTMLAERNITLRQSSYLKLLWILKSNESAKEKKKAQSLLRYLLAYEDEVNQFTIRNLFRNPEDKKVISLPLVRLEGGKLPQASSVKSDLVLSADKPVIKISWGGDVPSLVKLPLEMINFGKDLSLTFQNKIVGRYIRTKSDRWILSQRLDYGLDVNIKAGTIRTLFYLDLSQNVKNLKLDLPGLKSKGQIALNNALDFKGEPGSCYALVLLQKAFLERAIFMPEISANVYVDKIQLMHSLFAGNYVVIAGYKNISDFTGSIPKEILKTFVRSLQSSLQQDHVSQMRENILERELLDSVTDERLKAILDEGLSVPVVIGMSEKSRLKSVSDYAHVILVHDMKPIPEGYRLTAYDPNTGLNTLFVLNKRFRLDYPFYDPNYDYVPLIDRINAEALTLDHAVRSRGIDPGKVSILLEKSGVLILEPSEITAILP